MIDIFRLIGEEVVLVIPRVVRVVRVVRVLRSSSGISSNLKV